MYQKIPWKFIMYNQSNQENSMQELDDPISIFGPTTPYVILFSDNVGTTMFGGGYSLILGYTYTSSNWGAQLAFGYGGTSDIAYRVKQNGTWSDLVTLGVK